MFYASSFPKPRYTPPLSLREGCLLLFFGWLLGACIPPASHVLLEDQKVADVGRSRFSAGGAVGVLVGSSGPSFGGGGSWRIGVAKGHEVGVSASAFAYTFADTLSSAHLGLTLAHKWRFSRHAAWSSRLSSSFSLSDINVSPQIDTALIFGTDNPGLLNFYGGIRLGGGLFLTATSKPPLPWALGLWLSGGLNLALSPSIRLFTELGIGTQLFLSTKQENGVEKVETSAHFLGLFSLGFDFWLGPSSSF